MPGHRPPGRTSAALPSAYLAVAVTIAGAIACGKTGDVVELDPAPAASARGVGAAPPKREDELSPRLLRRFAPIEAPAYPGAPALVELGKALYFDPILSRSGTISCNSCHPLDRYGTTATAVSTGVGGAQGTRNAPSTYNAAGHFRQFWDGRAATLEEQALGPIQNPVEMGLSLTDAVRELRGVEGYGALFHEAFPDDPSPITSEHVAKAIAAFERGLVTPAPWDRYLRGETDALTPEQKEGAKLFANLGCMVCHSGPYLGGSMFEKLGAQEPWPNRSDLGRVKVTGNKGDEMTFKVPSLRNVTRTAPYFHDGSVARIEDAVRLMAKHQLGVDLTDSETASIVAWFESLRGELPLAYIEPPLLPEAHAP